MFLGCRSAAVSGRFAAWPVVESPRIVPAIVTNAVVCRTRPSIHEPRWSVLRCLLHADERRQLIQLDQSLVAESVQPLAPDGPELLRASAGRHGWIDLLEQRLHLLSTLRPLHRF